MAPDEGLRQTPAFAGDRPLTRLRFAKPPSPTRGEGKRSVAPISKKAPVETGARLMETKEAGLLVGALLERGAENVAQGRSRIGGAVLRDGLLLLGDFERLDRDLHLAGLLVELDHPRIDLLADREAFGALVVAIAGELGALDEGGEVGTDDLHLDTGF